MQQREDPELLCHAKSPLAAFVVAEEDIIDDMCKMSKVVNAMHERNQKTLASYTFNMVANTPFAPRTADQSNQEFLRIFMEQKAHENASNSDKEKMAKAFIQMPSAGMFVPVTQKTIATLGVVLSDKGCECISDSDRFLNKPLPEAVSSVSKALKLPLERVKANPRQSDIFTRGRLLRCFGPNFVWRKPVSFDMLLIKVSSPLFVMLCTPEGVFGEKCMSFDAIWVANDVKWAEDKPYDLVHRPGVEYYVQVSVEGFHRVFSTLVEHCAAMAGKHDDLI